MKLQRHLICAALAALLLAPSTLCFADPLEVELTNVNAAIKQKGGRWVAGETSMSRRSKKERQGRLGLAGKPRNIKPLDEAEDAGTVNGLDWRDNNGNFVTAVKDQGQCGSCWAFAMTGGLESYIRITQHKTENLSEQVLVSCGGVGSCNGGTLDADFLETTGLPPESYYRYTAKDGDCKSAKAGWQDHAFTIGHWRTVAQRLSSIKNALDKYGPLPTSYMVYEDFMHYKSGVYTHDTGKQEGGHAVLVVGYDDNEKCFIVKNSWGPDWGEKGFFRIAYSEMNSDVDFGGLTIAFKPVGVSRRVSAAARASHFNADSALSKIKSVVPLQP